MEKYIGITSVEAKVNKAAERLGIKPNGVADYILGDIVDLVVDYLDDKKRFSLNDMAKAIATHTINLVEPEVSGITHEISETLGLLGYDLLDGKITSRYNID